MSIWMRAVFEDLDFEQFPHPVTLQPAYRTNVGRYRLEAVQLTNSWLQPGWVLAGTVNTGRTLAMIQGELPLQVNSKEQGLALLSYFVGRHIPEHEKPPWLRIGERMTAHLPWATADLAGAED